MPYTPPSAEDVKAILSNKTAIKDNIDDFIADAEAVVSQIEGVGDDLKQRISKYLAAHFVSFPYPIIRDSYAIGGNSVTNYSRGQHGMMLDYTPYGQTAKMMDTSGTLARMEAKAKEEAKQKTAKIMAFG
jgi:hypothetical protein